MNRMLSALAVLSFSVVSCDESTAVDANALASLTVTPSTFSLTAGTTATFAVAAKTNGGAAITDAVAFAYTSAATSVADVGAGRVLGVGAGSTQITVYLTYKGVTRSIAVPVTVTGAALTAAAVVAGTTTNDFTPQFVVLKTSGTVTWTSSTRPHNVIFNVSTGAPANVPTGTILNVARSFATAGDYLYQCTVHTGMNAGVFVR